MTRQSAFVVLEGLDGVGTTTLARLVADDLRARDLRVCVTAEPTEGAIGQVLRAHVRREISLDPVTTALVFSADRADHLARTIRPALEAGEWVVCDRYLLSTLAYQGAEGVDREWILSLSESFEVPDLTVVLEAPDDVRAERMKRRRRADRYEDAGLAERLAASYRASIDLLRDRGHRIEIVDAAPAAPYVLAALKPQLDALG